MNLVILAAGMGSRFGGLKQIEPIDDDGNFIIDYSIYDAIDVGFDKVTFVIKKENYDAFRETVGKRIEKQVEVDYAFQEQNSFLPSEYIVNGRVKPWGTAHAILCAKDIVNDKFAIINADDYYGKESLKKIFDYLNSNNNDKDICMVGFKVKNTLTENGDVKRGVCKIKDGNLLGLTESVIREENNNIIAKSMLDNAEQLLSPDCLVSMNLFGFTPEIFGYLEKGFKDFLKENKKDLSVCEYFIPTILTKYVQENMGNLKVLDTNSKWYGLTYKKDFDIVRNGLKELVKNNIYPKHLWF